MFLSTGDLLWRWSHSPLHWVAPNCSVVFPDGQAVQTVCLSASVKFPMGHSWHIPVASFRKLPRVHSTVRQNSNHHTAVASHGTKGVITNNITNITSQVVQLVCYPVSGEAHTQIWINEIFDQSERVSNGLSFSLLQAWCSITWC